MAERAADSRELVMDRTAVHGAPVKAPETDAGKGFRSGIDSVCNGGAMQESFIALVTAAC